MAITKFGSISLLMIAVASCLIMVTAEEELPASTARQAKQIFLVPSMTPASTFPLGYYGRNPLAYPFLMPQPGSPILSNPVEQQPEASEWPMVPSANDEQGAAWRVYDAIDDTGAKWWRRRYNREAVISINPSTTECTKDNIGTDGLGPCKRASQANQGTISIKFTATDQIAVIALTANSPVNTRVRLICNEITEVALFTQTGKISTVADTPRTEVGYMQLVATSTADNAVLKCFWITYRHYTATYP